MVVPRPVGWMGGTPGGLIPEVGGWRVIGGNFNWLGEEMNEWELVYELTKFMAYYCAERKNKEATVARKLIAATFFHEQLVGLSLPWQHFRIKAVKKGTKGSHVEGREPDAGEEIVNMGDDEGDGGEHRRMECGGKDTMRAWVGGWD